MANSYRSPLLLLSLCLMLFLAACERPASNSDVEPLPVNQTDQIQPQPDQGQTDATVTEEGAVEQPAAEQPESTTEESTTEQTETTTTESTTEPAAETEAPAQEETTAESTSEQTTEETPREDPAPAESSDPQSYSVVAGDTLGQIAERFGVSVEDLAAANNLTNVDTLDVGQALIIPAAGYAETVSEQATETTEAAETQEEQIHTVQAGENLYRIGLAYGFTVAELAAYNGLTNVNALDVGQQIKIPPTN